MDHDKQGQNYYHLCEIVQCESRDTTTMHKIPITIEFHVDNEYTMFCTHDHNDNQLITTIRALGYDADWNTPVEVVKAYINQTQVMNVHKVRVCNADHS